MLIDCQCLPWAGGTENGRICATFSVPGTYSLNIQNTSFAGEKATDLELFSIWLLLFARKVPAGEIKGVTTPQFFYLNFVGSLLYKLRFPYTHFSRNYFEIHRGRLCTHM